MKGSRASHFWAPYDETSGDRSTRLLRSSIVLLLLWLVLTLPGDALASLDLLFPLAVATVAAAVAAAVSDAGFGKRTPSYWTPFSSIVTISCGLPFAEFAVRQVDCLI